MESRDKTERFMDAAKQRAHEVVNEANPKLTSLERGYWLALRNRRGRERCISQRS
jgi:hypothetical protein